MAVKFKDTININGEYTFPNTDGSVGQAIVTDGGGNLTFGSAVASSADDSESVHIPVKNTSGVSISKGTPVYITGETGNSGKIEIAAADAVNANKMPALGLLESTLSNNSEGFCVQGGLLENIATATIDGQTPTANQTVYVKSGGGLTLTKPTGTALIQNIAKVARVHASQGSLVVSAILRANDIPNLPEGKIWVGADNTTVSTIVHLDELNGRVGIGTDNPTHLLTLSGISPYIRIERSGVPTWEIRNNFHATGYGLSIYDVNASKQRFAANVSEVVINEDGDDYDFRVESSNSANAVFVRGSDGNVGIGTTSPSSALQIASTAGTNVYDAELSVIDTRPLAANTGGGIRFGGVYTSTGTTNGDLAFIRALKDNATSGNYSYSMAFGTRKSGQSPAERMRITSGGRVGIGISSPSSILHLLGADGNNKQLRLATSQTTYWDIGRSNLTGHFEITEDSGDTYFLIDKDNGNVGISVPIPTLPFSSSK